MGLSLQQLRDDLREHLGVDDVELDNTSADLLLNRAWWQLADENDFKEKETSRTYNTAVGTSTYATTADANGIQQVSIKDANSAQHDLLAPMTLLLYESDFIDRTDSRGKPTNYLTRSTNIILWPTPDAVYEITEYYWKTIADISAGGVTVPQAWHELILYGALYRGFARAGDYNRSRAARIMQQELQATKETINTKEKVDLPHAGIRLLRPRYP